jgi:hypothetical protein
MTTTFKTGQQVRSRVDAQGMAKGAVYEVVDVQTQWIVGSCYATYIVHDKDNDRELSIGNGHLVLESAVDYMAQNRKFAAHMRTPSNSLS